MLYLLHQLLPIRQLVDQSLDDLEHGSGLHSVRRHSAKQVSHSSVHEATKKFIQHHSIILTEAAVENLPSAGS